MKAKRTRFAVGLLAALLGVVAGQAAYGSPWKQYVDPAAAGWAADGLAEAKRIAEQGGAAAVMIVEDDVVVAAWGAIDRPLPIHSMRKGLYNAMAGVLVEDGSIDLDATLDELGINDVAGLTDAERSATVEDLLASRSGVYHVSAYEPASMKRNRPERGSHQPGEHWFYNNWDFNVVAYLIERASDATIEAFFRSQLAEPLGMEDVDDHTVFSFFEPSRSQYAAPIFRMSARDLARFGALFVKGGLWEGRTILEPSWIKTSWAPYTRFTESEEWEDASGFGYMWWVHERRPGRDRPFSRHDIYLTRGSNGQVVAVIPARDLVIVHLTDTESGEGGSFEGAVRVIDAVIGAKHDARDEEPRRKLLDPEPLPGIAPAPAQRTSVAWSADDIEKLKGEFALNPQISFLIHEVDGRLFALPRGIPLAEVELFRDCEGTIFSPVVDLELASRRSQEGTVTALSGRMEGRTVRMERVPSE